MPYGGQTSQAPAYPVTPVLHSQYGAPLSGDSYGAGYHRATVIPKPYPQPMPASYTTASTSAGPHFNVQVKVAQPVPGYHQPRRRAEQAYGPPSPRQGYGAKPPPQYTSEVGVRTRHNDVDPGYPEPPSYGRRLREGGLGKLASPAGHYPSGMATPGTGESVVVPSQVPAGGGGFRYQHQVKKTKHCLREGGRSDEA